MLQKLKATVIPRVLKGFFHLISRTTSVLSQVTKCMVWIKITGLCIKSVCTGFITSITTMEEVRPLGSPGSVPVCQAKVTLVPRARRFLVTWCLKAESPNRVRMRVFLSRFRVMWCPFSSPELVVSWSHGLETRGAGSSRYRYRMSVNYGWSTKEV